MGRLLWPLALIVTFFVGWAAATFVRTGPAAVQEAEQHETVTRLQQQVDTLQARLRAREDLAALRQSGAASPRLGAVEERPAPQGIARSARAESSQTALHIDRAASPSRTTPVTAAQVQAALDRFYRYLEATNDSTAGRERWQRAREMVDEMRAMGPAAGQALMQVLASGTDTDERRAAARLLGQLQVAQALPVLKGIVENDNDLLLRRAAAAGLRQLQTPESLPVLERILTQPGEDRFVRLSAAVGLAESNRPLGVAGLTTIFEESTADGRGRDMAFRALANLKDERSLPFMRQLAGSQVEPGYRLQAIRYLSAQGDQQALGTLQALAHAPNEQPSIRDAAAQAYSTINGAKK